VKNPAQTLKNLQPWLLSTLSGVLLVLIFPRFNLEFLAWFALVPLFFSIQDQPLARATWLGFWAGMVFYFFGLYWVTNTLTNYGNIPLWLSIPILALLAAYLSFFLAIFCHLLNRLTQKNSLFLFLLAPFLWTGLEYLRSTHEDYGFSWLGLGYSQYLTLPVVQIADITGVYGVSALIVLINAALFYLLRFLLFPPGIEKPMPVRVTALTILILGLCLGYGYYSLGKYQASQAEGSTLRIALAQGNIPQHLKWDSAYQNQVFDIYQNLTLKAQAFKPELIIWPEAATPFYYQLNQEGTQKLNALAQKTGIPLFVGSPFLITEGEQTTYLNSAFLISREGTNEGRYDKIHLVPFGEFVPFKKILFFVRKMVSTIGDFGKGQEATLFDLKGNKFGVSICYEITFPDLVRQSVRNGAQFLVNITNDAWFGKSAASFQHMAMGALRAVENRVPIVRAANTGISGTIDPDGTIRDTTQLFEEDLVLTRITPSNNGPTPYARYGDVFCWLCIGLAGIFGWLGKSNPRNY
jgi:apolipoprotein N-acyltransferase